MLYKCSQSINKLPLQDLALVNLIRQLNRVFRGLLNDIKHELNNCTADRLDCFYTVGPGSNINKKWILTSCKQTDLFTLVIYLS